MALWIPACAGMTEGGLPLSLPGMGSLGAWGLGMGAFLDSCQRGDDGWGLPLSLLGMGSLAAWRLRIGAFLDPRLRGNDG